MHPIDTAGAPSQEPVLPSSRNHVMSDAVLLRTVARQGSNLSEVARAQLLAIAAALAAPGERAPSEAARHADRLRNYVETHPIDSNALTDALAFLDRLASPALQAEPVSSELPVLPRAAYSLDLNDGHPVAAYSAQQMYDFARTAQQDVLQMESLAKLGWQAVECDICGSSARAFPPAQAAAVPEAAEPSPALQAAAVPPQPEPVEGVETALHAAPTDEQIEAAVTRFLGWRLPDNFSPDCGISFQRVYNEKSPFGPQNHEPTGTNLLSADQARAMFAYALAAPGKPQGAQS